MYMNMHILYVQVLVIVYPSLSYSFQPNVPTPPPSCPPPPPPSPSSLLPYLHMLMDPLVSALNGSQTLISQGLRTLELCVDNLQPDFLYDHIQPVRAELMQALWRTLHNPDDSVAAVAYRVLGKFGGSNRKMINTPQPVCGVCVSVCLSVYV